MTEGNYSNVGHRWPVYKGLGAMNPCDLSKRRKVVAEFRLSVGHDCLGTRLHRVGIRPEPYCRLCSLHQPMDRNHLGQRTALSNRTECERYWKARTKMMENWLLSFSILSLWLLLIIMAFMFTLNVLPFYVYYSFNLVFIVYFFYFYWSHRSMINNQCTCH
jgi:hypothetical protein